MRKEIGRREERKIESWLIAKAPFSNRFFLQSSIFYFLFSLPLITNADDIRDVKGPVNLPEFPWIYVLCAVLAVMLVLGGWWFWLRFKKSASPKITKTSWQIALEQLQALRERDLFGQGRFKEHFIELSNIARRYIEQRFDIRAPEMTTEEFLAYVRNSPKIDGKHKETLKGFLKLSDMVKFAKYGPSADEARQSYNLITQLVNETVETLSVAEGRKTS